MKAKRSLLLVFLLMGVLLIVEAHAAVVTLTGTYPDSVIGTEDPYAHPAFSFEFHTPLNPVPPAIVESRFAFIVPVMVTYTNNGTPRLLEGAAGYFSYPNGHAGVDLRFTNWTGDDWIQIMFICPQALYAGQTVDPTLLVTDIDGSIRFAHHNPHEVVFTAESSHYSLTPEPTTALLLGFGGLGISLRRRKRLAKELRIT